MPSAAAPAPLRVAIPDMISPSYFPAIAAVELGFFQREGLDATIELVFPVTTMYETLREGEIDFAGGAAHAPLYAFPEWEGCRLVCALSQKMYWFLVARADLQVARGDLGALTGLRIGAAPGPVDGLRRLLAAAGIDPDGDVDIGPVPGVAGAGVSFGVSAAKALAAGKVDAFWANGMGAEVAVRDGVGTLVLDARRGDGPPEAEDYTFPAFVVTQERIEERPQQVAGAVRAIVRAQRALRQDPSLATAAARPHFPQSERNLIAELIRRDTAFYDPAISERSVVSLNRFARAVGVLSDRQVPYERVVATGFRRLWTPTGETDVVQRGTAGND